MAHTNAWNETSPAGTDLVSSLDNTIRAKLLDIRERMELEHAWNDAVSGDMQDGMHINFILGMCEGRLTLTTALPVTPSDVLAATTLYFTPYKGNRIALYDGTQWLLKSFTELSIAVPATTDTMYDVFVYSNAGTVTLELAAWTNDTTRATALVTQNGVLCKTGALTRRYVGTFRTTGVSGQTEDSRVKRLVWNYYNRVPRSLVRKDSTDTWTQTVLATWRYANASAANRVDFVIGVAESVVDLRVHGMSSSNTGGQLRTVGVNIDVNNAVHADSLSVGVDSVAGTYSPSFASLTAQPAAGFHYGAWLEYTAAGTTTWQGDVGGTIFATGITGTIH